jgi:GT2 family glycosyltransferase
MASASGEYVVQLDGDASIETPGWVERMLAFFERDERVGVVTAKVVLDNGLVHACGIDATGPEACATAPRQWRSRSGGGAGTTA